jgi:hypothetical protein
MTKMGDLKFTTAGDYISAYTSEDVEIILKQYNSYDVDTWPFYPIVMPLKEGQGPASDAECDEITWEVWDRFCNSYGNFKYLPEAINESLKLTKELLGND